MRIPEKPAPPPAPVTALAAAALLAACGPGEGAPPPRGVLLISVDSLRADHMSCYGYESRTAPDIPTTPLIDRMLAERGTVFEHAVATTSWTLPSHMSMLSGLPNELHGVFDLPETLHESHTLIAQVFERAGWRTAGFFSGPNLHPVFGFGRGFEEYVDCSAEVVEDPSVFDVKSIDGFETVKELHDRSHVGITGPTVVREFERWLDGVGEDEPFFAFLHFWDVHYDYTPPPEHDVFDPDYRGRVSGVDFKDFVMPTPYDKRDLEHLLALYDGEIHFTDHNVGLVLARLEAEGRLDDTLVVFTSDHGEEFMDHKKFGHKGTLYEEVMHVPLILRYPAGVPEGERVDELVSIIDIAPTILDLCGLPRTERMWGRSLTPAFDGELEPRPVPIELTWRYQSVMMRGLHAGDWKVVKQTPRGPIGVFELDVDPEEDEFKRAAQIGPNDSRLEEARAMWSELDELGKQYARGGAGQLPKELQRDLEAFGYTHGDAPDEDG